MAPRALLCSRARQVRLNRRDQRLYSTNTSSTKHLWLTLTSLFAAILADRRDDTLRLTYADAIEPTGIEHEKG